MYSDVLKQEERFGLCLWSLNDKKKGTAKDFSSYKLTSKLCLMYLDVKPQQEYVRLMHLEVKIPQNGRNKVFGGKQTTRYHWCF